MSWRCRAIINPNAWVNNFIQAQKLHPNSSVMAVVKSNAYGHGIEHAISALSKHAKVFAVASIEEAIACRELAPRHRIVVLSQFYTSEHARLCQHYQIELVVSHLEHIDLVRSLPNHTRLSVWLKVDTGMGRLGVLPNQLEKAVSELQSVSSVDLIGVMTHFANADDVTHELTESQIRCFKSLPLDNKCAVSLANSAAVMEPKWRRQLQQIAPNSYIRPGIMLTGASPFAHDEGGLKARSVVPLDYVMSLQARLMQIRILPAKHAIGYGSRYVTPEQMPVGVISIGYGDGYPRVVCDDAYVVINGQPAKILGRISMDSISVDLRTVTDAKVGDVATLWGQELPIEKVADWANTISYELYCRLTARVPRVLKPIKQDEYDGKS